MANNVYGVALFATQHGGRSYANTKVGDKAIQECTAGSDPVLSGGQVSDLRTVGSADDESQRDEVVNFGSEPVDEPTYDSPYD